MVGLVYRIICEECDESYIGETERLLKSRFSDHLWPSSAISDISRHIYQDEPGHSIEMEKSQILFPEPSLFISGAKKAIYIDAMGPSFNQKSNIIQIHAIWDNLVKTRMKDTRARVAMCSNLQ